MHENEHLVIGFIKCVKMLSHFILSFTNSSIFIGSVYYSHCIYFSSLNFQQVSGIFNRNRLGKRGTDKLSIVYILLTSFSTFLCAFASVSHHIAF